MTEEVSLRDHGSRRRSHQDMDDPEWTVDHRGVHAGVGMPQRDCGPQRKPHWGGMPPKGRWTIEEPTVVQGYM